MSQLTPSFHPSPPHPLSQTQLFWEAFPAGTGPSDRTTYLFSYVDADPARPSLADLMGAYLDLLPDYQARSVDRGRCTALRGFVCSGYLRRAQ